MNCTSHELFQYEGKYPGSRAIGFIIAKALENANDPSDERMLQILKERCFQHSLQHSDLHLSKTFAYTQAIQLSQKILN